MRIFTDEQPLIDGGAVYLRTVSLSFLLTGISQLYLCALKNCGKAGKSSIISSTSVAVNLVLNAVLIFGLFGIPRMEIAGAALQRFCQGLSRLYGAFSKPQKRTALN